MAGRQPNAPMRTKRDIESEQRVANLRDKFSSAIGEILKSSNNELAYEEIFAALSLTMVSWSSYLRKIERRKSE